MGFTGNSLQVETVTPEKANEFLRYNYAHNRRYRPAWVEYLAREMREGRFMPTAEIHIMYRNGEPVMINGQHTCRAIIMYGKPVRVTVRKTTTHEVGQIAMAYAFGHDTGIRRSFTDGMNAYGLTEQTDLPSLAINNLASAIKYIRGNFQVDSKSGNAIKDSPADVVGYVLNLVPVMKMFNAFVMPCEKKLLKNLRRRSCLSIALLTFYYQPEKAAAFWSQIAHPDNLAWNDPRVTARKYIETTQVGKSGAAKLSRQVARCWRAFCKGEQLSMVTGINEAAFISIEGTPYNGKQTRGYLSIQDETPAWVASDELPALMQPTY